MRRRQSANRAEPSRVSLLNLVPAVFAIHEGGVNLYLAAQLVEEVRIEMKQRRVEAERRSTDFMRWLVRQTGYGASVVRELGIEIPWSVYLHPERTADIAMHRMTGSTEMAAELAKKLGLAVSFAENKLKSKKTVNVLAEFLFKIYDGATKRVKSHGVNVDAWCLLMLYSLWHRSEGSVCKMLRDAMRKRTFIEKLSKTYKVTSDFNAVKHFDRCLDVIEKYLGSEFTAEQLRVAAVYATQLGAAEVLGDLGEEIKSDETFLAEERFEYIEPPCSVDVTTSPKFLQTQEQAQPMVKAPRTDRPPVVAARTDWPPMVEAPRRDRPPVVAPRTAPMQLDPLNDNYPQGVLCTSDELRSMLM